MTVNSNRDAVKSVAIGKIAAELTEVIKFAKAREHLDTSLLDMLFYFAASQC